MIGGFALVLTGGNLISVLDNGHFTVLGRSDFETIKYSVWTLLAFTLLCGYLLSRTTYGRRVYASGGNPEAARLSGVRVNLVKASTFALSGTAAGIAGVIVSSRVATGQADSGGLGIALDAVAGIVIGGTLDPRRRRGDLADGARRPTSRHDRKRLQPTERQFDLPAHLPRRDHRVRSRCRRLVAALGLTA